MEKTSLKVLTNLDLDGFYQIAQDEESRLAAGGMPCQTLQQAQEL